MKITFDSTFLYFSLKNIAGLKDGRNGGLVSNEKPFVCPSDGHFGDPNDCTKFYKCAHKSQNLLKNKNVY